MPRCARRIAGVHRKLLEPMDLRTMTVDDERCRAIRAGLDGQCKEQESGQPPVLCGQSDKRGDAGDDWQDHAAGHDGTDDRRVRQLVRSVAGQVADEALVRAGHAVDMTRAPVTRNPAAIESEAMTANAISIPHRYV
jgi:hypothetical protein